MSLAKLQEIKRKADKEQRVRDNYKAYTSDRLANGWTKEDLTEYRRQVERIMSSGTDDEKLAASEFWESKRHKPEEGINDRIKASLHQEQKVAA